MEVYINNFKKNTFEHFCQFETQINVKFGNLKWMELPNRRASRIKKIISANFREKENCPEYFKWLGNTALEFQDTFLKY